MRLRRILTATVVVTPGSCGMDRARSPVGHDARAWSWTRVRPVRGAWRSEYSGSFCQTGPPRPSAPDTATAAVLVTFAPSRGPHHGDRVAGSGIGRGRQARHGGGECCQAGDSKSKVQRHDTNLAADEHVAARPAEHRADDCGDGRPECDEADEVTAGDTQGTAPAEVAPADEHVGQHDHGDEEGANAENE